MFASLCYDLGSTLGCMWDVFHPSQPMPGGFSLEFSSTLRRAQNCSIWNCLIRPTAWPELVLGDVKSMDLPFISNGLNLTSQKISFLPHVENIPKKLD